jgi:hypothetical protein
MICSKPIHKDGFSFGCGQCMPCRINKRREWSTRIMLESTQHVSNLFTTCTYAPEFLPENASLKKSDLQSYFKRLRRKTGSFRYFAVGEYGDDTCRPHYHIAFFGLADVQAVHDAWGLGNTFTGTLTPQSATYIAGYTTKKLSKPDDPRLLPGQLPEFTIMSLKPGIGATAAADIAEALNTSQGAKHVSKLSDFPKTVRIAGREESIGRYLHQQLYKWYGVEARSADSQRLARYNQLSSEITQSGTIETHFLRLRSKQLASDRKARFQNSLKGKKL